MKKNNGTQMRYLQRIGYSYYARVKVPPSLQQVVGNTHIRQALHTRDLDEANLRKWKVVDAIKAQLNRLKGLDAGNMKAENFRRDIKKALEQNKPELAEAIEYIVSDEAEKMLKKTGSLKRVRQWYDLATATGPTLDELIDVWLADTTYSRQTKQQHKKAYTDLRQHLGGDSLPQQVTDEVAVAYVEDVLKKSGKSYATVRRTLNSLVAFWTWLGLRGHVPRQTGNVWKGFRLTKAAFKVRRNGQAIAAAKAETPGQAAEQTPSTSKKRAYSEEELVQLFSGKPKYPGLADVIVIGLYTGARLDEICSLEKHDIKQVKASGRTRGQTGGYYLITIPEAKTEAGRRTLAVAHKFPCEILARRLALESESKQLFPEFSPGGYDGKLSWAVSKAFGRYRDKVKLSRATDFHSLRRTLITLMENLRMDPVRIARYAGHEVPTIALSLYSGGSSEQTNLEVAKEIKYPAKVEQAVVAFLLV